MQPSKFEAILCACKWCWRWHESNPEVGMGPSYISVVNQVCNSLEINVVGPKARQEVVEYLRAWHQAEGLR